jgi:hypothetical protein
MAMDLQRAQTTTRRALGYRSGYGRTIVPPARRQRARRSPLTGAAWQGATLAAVFGLALGALTDWGQSQLPWYADSLTNSAGSWVLVAFLAGLAASRIRRSIVYGSVCMVSLVIGYYFSAAERGIPVAASIVIFWTMAAVVFGPIVGLAAGWVRHGEPIRMGAGAGVLAGVLAGESVYALRYLSGSTSTAYWTIQLLLALTLGVGLAWRGSRRMSSLFVSAIIGILVAGVVCAIEVSA